MSQSHNTISALIVRYVKGEATPEEKRELEEWASRSAENRIWFEEFSDPEWLQKQADIYHNIDLDERSKIFWSKVAAKQAQQTQQAPQAPQVQQTQQSGERGKLKAMYIFKWSMKAAAAALVIFGTCVYFYFASQREKNNSTASLSVNNKEMRSVVDSTSPLPRPIPSMHRATNKVAKKPKRIAPAKNNATASSFNNTIETLPAIDSSGQQEGDTIPAINNNPSQATGNMRYMHACQGGALTGPEIIRLPIPAEGFLTTALPDSSEVWLNSVTKFNYPQIFKGNKRRVEITGEAYFEVVPNDTMPFLAVVNGTHVETIGARFNIRAHGNEDFKKITVLSGTVRVTTGPDEVILKAKQSALIENKKPITIVLHEDTDKVIAWKDRQFLFKQDNLCTVIRELVRWYNLIPVGNVNSNATISYSGPRAEKVDDVLTKMQQLNKNFHYKIEGRQLIIE